MISAAIAVWFEGLTRASWQGGGALAGVWLVCRLLPALPPTARCWMWRIAYLKVLLSLFRVHPVPLPILPPEPPAVVRGSVPPGSSMPVAGVGSPAGAEGRLRINPPWSRPSVLSCLWGIWFVGFLVSLTGVFREIRQGKQLKAHSQEVIEGVVSREYRRLCRQMRLRQPPPLRFSERTRSPLLLGSTKPVILLPAGMAGSVPTGEIRLILAHELAHHRRRDLRWSWLPAITHALFFFHPAVRIAHPEWRLAHEMACDEEAMRVTGVSAGDYGSLLVKLAAPQRSGWQWGTAALGEEQPRTLKKRLNAMKQMRPPSRRQTLATGLVLGAVASVVLVPWKAVAQSSPPTPAVKSTVDPPTSQQRPAEAPSPSGKDLPSKEQPAVFPNLLQEIGVTGAQRALLLKTLADEQKAADAIKLDPSLSDPAKGDRMTVLFQTTEARIRSSLTPSQHDLLNAHGGIKALYVALTPKPSPVTFSLQPDQKAQIMALVANLRRRRGSS